MAFVPQRMHRTLVTGFLLLSLASRAVHAACANPFESPDYYPTGVDARQIALVNFNGDDLPDALIRGQKREPSIVDALVVLPALETGGFGAPLFLHGRVSTGSFATADFDRDGYDDIVLVDDDWNQGRQLLFFQNQRGVLAAPVAYPLAFLAEPVVGDFNGDARPDVAVLTGDTVTLLHGDGAGAFVTSTYAGFEGRYLRHGAAGDFDRDGFDDLIATGADQSVTIFFGAGNGGFREKRVRSYAGTLRRPAILDHDRDGRLDAVFAFETTSNRVRIIRDLAGEAKIDLILLHETFPYPASALAAADFDGDGGETIVAVTRDGGVLAGGLHYLALGPTGEGVIALGDPNRDGRIDVVTATDENLVVLRGTGAGTFSSPIDIGDVHGSADFNGDGLMDLIGDSVRLQNPDGSYRATSTIRFNTGGPVVQPMIGDVDRDGDLDFVYLTKSSSLLGLTVGVGRGDGTFVLEEKSIQATFEGEAGWLADLDGDGYLDVLARISTPGNSPFLAIAPGRADGRFDPWLAFTTSALGFPADFDADGDTDILGHRSIWFNDGTGRFTEKTRTVEPNFKVEAVADLDADGLPDLLYFEVVDTEELHEWRLVLARGDGSGEFHRSASIAIPATGRVQIGDFNGDGRRDVLITGRNYSATQYSAVAFGNGQGGFLRLAPFVKWYEHTYLRPVTVVDFNRDGRDDIIDGHFIRLSTCFEPVPKRRAVRR